MTEATPRLLSLALPYSGPTGMGQGAGTTGHRLVPHCGHLLSGASTHLAVEAGVAQWAGTLVGAVAVLAGAAVQAGP